MFRSNKMTTVLAVCLWLATAALGTGCDDRADSGGVPQPVRTTPPRALRIDYKYDGKFGVYGIADAASAHDGATLLAEARALRIVEKVPGPNQIEVEETHYSSEGNISYRGTLIIRFGFGGGVIEREIAVFGTKERNYFSGWPSGS